MNNLFIDTDVILDLFIDRKPHHENAVLLFSKIKRNKLHCYTSPVIVANTFYILSKIKGKHYAIGKIKRLRRIMNILTITEKIIDLAIETPSKDFEDSIQYYCAKENKMSAIITRNVDDFPREKISIMEPIEVIKMIGKED